VFDEAASFLTYLATLREGKGALACRLYAYCLMTNHVHLIVDPGDDPASLGRLMQRVAGRYTWIRNRHLGRTGSAWESRYRSSPIDSERYLLACCRYIDLNPCRAGIVDRPEQYRWSSYRDKVGLRTAAWLDWDPCYLELGDTPSARCNAYKLLVRSGLPETDDALIRESVNRDQLTGDTAFSESVERRLGRRIRRPRRVRSRRV
jgi:putative transposase